MPLIFKMATRKFVPVSCKNCQKQWEKRADCIKGWHGYCHSCNVRLHSKMPSVAKSRDPNFLPTRQQMVEVTCQQCGGKDTITYGASVDKRRNGICRTCKNIEVANRVEIKQKKSENARKQVLRQGGIPNARLLTAEMVSGENNFNWKGGITPKMNMIRSTYKMRKWRFAVFERDQYACVICKNDRLLEVDHIQPFSLFPELRTDVSNGRTLCKPCHLKHGVLVRRDRIIRQATGFPVDNFLTT